LDAVQCTPGGRAAGWSLHNSRPSLRKLGAESSMAIPENWDFVDSIRYITCDSTIFVGWISQDCGTDLKIGK